MTPRHVSHTLLLGVLVRGLATVLLVLAVAVAPAHAQAPRAVRSLQDLSEEFERLVSQVNPAVVQIVATGYSPGGSVGEVSQPLIARHRASGSGVVVSAQGHVLTNLHVIQGARRIRVVFPPDPVASPPGSIVRPQGQTLDASVVGVDEETDLAVLKVQATPARILTLGDSDTLKQGQLVFAFGSPLGLTSSVTMGIVSAVGRQRQPDDPMVYVQTDASINPGSSGGPLVDRLGRVVGINTFILSQSGGNEGLGFAVPANIVRSVFEQIASHGRVRRGTMDAVLQSITPVLAAGLKLSRESGVVIADVTPGGSADAAGLVAGDVVLALDGKPMENARQLEVNLYRRAVGDVVKLDVLRGREERTVYVAVSERADDPGRLMQFVTPERNVVDRIGLLVLDVDERVRAVLPALRVGSGVVVVARETWTPVTGDLRPGDVIASMNGLPIGSVAEFRRVLEALPPGSACALHVQRGGQLRFVGVELP